MNNSAGDLRIWPLGVVTSQGLLSLYSLNPDRYPYLLESAASSSEGCNADILLAFPGERLVLRSQSGLSAPSNLLVNNSDSFLEVLDKWWQSQRTNGIVQEMPFHGGWFLYLSYELAAQIEPSLKKHIRTSANQLIAQAVRVPAAIIRNAQSGESWFVSENDADAESRFSQLNTDLFNSANKQVQRFDSRISSICEDASQIFVDAVEVAQKHIAAGDIYQANLSRGWHAQVMNPQADELYHRLKLSNPGPFAGLIRLDQDHFIISSSPERLIEVRNGWANTRPIAGTRKRHENVLQDQSLIRELREHPKERAEHIMLLDLERNDLGKICTAGSVEVDQYMHIETYRHVHHIVSNVRGRLRDDVTPAQAIAAVFPGGTITGCPKVRCMEIIASLEPESRGAYTGSMGYLNRDGSMDLNILIRTMELQGSTLRFRAGAGIVADSIPDKELDETRAKALGLLRALE